MKSWQMLTLGLMTAVLFNLGALAQQAPADLTEDEKRFLEALSHNEHERLLDVVALNAERLPASYASSPATETQQALAAVGKTPQGSPFRRQVQVASSAELRTALASAQPGDWIVMADGVYVGPFQANVDGTAAWPITLQGSRGAVLQTSDGMADSGYGFHLTGDYWVLAGFTIRQALKGLMLDGASHNLITGLEIHNIGDEGLHLRLNSAHNRVQYNWIHDTGLRMPEYGEGIYIGSAADNWGSLTNGQPDRSDHNQLVANLIGPGITAEAIDVKEGTAEGFIYNNTFLASAPPSAADSWVDLKGNRYEVRDNQGLRPPQNSSFTPYAVIGLASEWGKDNQLTGNEDMTGRLRQAFRVFHAPTHSVSIVLPERGLAYTLSEIIARYPQSFEQLDARTFLLKEHLVAGPNSVLQISTADADSLRLLSDSQRFVSINGLYSIIRVVGAAQAPFAISSWNPAASSPDETLTDGRAYVLMLGGRMDAAYVSFAYLGFAPGMTAGVVWKESDPSQVAGTSSGTVLNTQFTHNFVGASAQQASNMRWLNNTFAHNLTAGLALHDFSTDFLIENNTAEANGGSGMVFSHGSSRHVVRGSTFSQNAGHGIMINDGPLVNPYATQADEALQGSDDIRIEGCAFAGNEDAIMVKGSRGTVITGNHIDEGHRYGVHLREGASQTTVSHNSIYKAESSAVFLDNYAFDNLITDNQMMSVDTPVMVKNSPRNTITHNTLEEVRPGAAVVFEGSVLNTVLQDNILIGYGHYPILLKSAVGHIRDAFISHNDLSGWLYPPPEELGMISAFVWLLLILIPMVMKAFVLVRHRFNYRYLLVPEHHPPASPEG